MNGIGNGIAEDLAHVRLLVIDNRIEIDNEMEIRMERVTRSW